MGFDTIIRKLQTEREALDQLITHLEQIKSAGLVQQERVKKRRGRKFMDAAERGQVSERMKKYWAERRIGRMQGGTVYPESLPPSPTVTHTVASSA